MKLSSLDHCQHKKVLDNAGLGLVEVLVAVGLLAVLSLATTELLDQQRKITRDMNLRFEILGLSAEIKQVLADADSCLETFKEADIKELSDESQTLKVHSIKSVRPNGSSRPTILEKFRDYSLTGEGKKYRGVGIARYELSTKEEEVKLGLNDFIGDAYLSVHYDKGKNFLGNRIFKQKIRVQFIFDPLDASKLISCSTTGTQSSAKEGAQLVFINPNLEPSLENKTGLDACQSKGLSCLYVQSSNYTRESYGDDSLSSVCASSYNTDLTGVSQGLGLPSFHSCQARLGTFTTFQLTKEDSGVKCAGAFTALCQ